MLWAIFLYKELTIRRCMQKKYTAEIFSQASKRFACYLFVNVKQELKKELNVKQRI